MSEIIKVNKKIMILVSEECNLNCVYCYEHFKNHKKMNFKMAKKIIDDFYDNTVSGDTVLIEVFGGEAFTNFELIKQIDDYVMKKYSDRINLFETTTNGTLIHGEIQEWLEERKDRYDISLSLDGTEKMHDANRPMLSGKGSFEKIDIDFFLRTWDEAQAKLTISNYTLPRLAEGIKYIHELGFVCDATMSTGMDWNYDDYKDIMVRELGKLIDYYTNNPELKLCTMLNYDLRLVFSKLNHGHRFCGACELTTCYDSKGNQYPCQGFAPVSLGKDAAKFINYDEKKMDLSLDNPCVKCKFFFLCANCYSANYCVTGCTHHVDVNLCKAYRLCILASSKIQFNRLKLKEQYTNDDRLTLKAIEIIQEEMSEFESPWLGEKKHVCNTKNRCC